MFQEIAIGWAAHYLTGELATYVGKDVNWTAVKSRVLAWLQQYFHNAWFASTAGGALCKCLDDFAAECEKSDENETLIKELAAKDFDAAYEQIKERLASYLPKELEAAVKALPAAAPVQPNPPPAAA